MVQCVVYNASREPLAVVSAERGFKLWYEGLALIIEEHPTKKFHTVKDAFPVPTSIVLKEYRKTGARYYHAAQLNQRNLFIRDEWTCQYCLRHLFELTAGKEYLTRDHVDPLSRGGKDVWDNVVTACSTCNHKKDSNRPHEVGLVLKRPPKAPTVFEIMQRRSKQHGKRKKSA